LASGEFEVSGFKRRKKRGFCCKADRGKKHIHYPKDRCENSYERSDKGKTHSYPKGRAKRVKVKAGRIKNTNAVQLSLFSVF
jgi:hypothetical protein